MKNLYLKLRKRICLARVRIDVAKAEEIIENCLSEIDKIHAGSPDDEKEQSLLLTIKKALDLKLYVADNCYEGLNPPTIIDRVLSPFA